MTILRAAVTTRKAMLVTARRMRWVETSQMTMIRNCGIITSVDREREKKNRAGRDMREAHETGTGMMAPTVQMNAFIKTIKNAGQRTEVARAPTKNHEIVKTHVRGNSRSNLTEKELGIVKMMSGPPCTVSRQVVTLSRKKSDRKGRIKREGNLARLLLKRWMERKKL